MPVNAAEALETEHAARAAGELRVVEDLFVDSAHGFARGFDVTAILRRQRVQRGIEVADVREIAVEPVNAAGIPVDNPPVALRQHLLEQGDGFYLFFRYLVFLQEPRQFPVRVQHEGLLIGAIDIALEERFDNRNRLLRTDRSGAQRRNLSLQHRVQGVE